MIALACLLTLAAATRINLVDEVYSIPADKWHYVDVSLKQQSALVLAHYESPDNPAVRVALMRREDMEHLFDGLPYGVVRESGPGRTGTLRAQVAPGDYAIVVDNRESTGRPATVHLRVWLDFSKGPSLTQISPQRQLVVILVSFAVFFTIVGYSMAKLWKSFQGRG
jgi:hypothetical protein